MRWTGAVLVLLVAAPSPAGEPQLRLLIRSVAGAPRVGDPIHVEFVVTNVGDGEHRHWDRTYASSGRLEEYRFEVVDAAGEPVPDPRGGLARDGSASDPGAPTRPIRRGGAFRRVVVLNRWARITRAGDYRVVGVYDPSSASGAAQDSFLRQKGCRSAPITIRVAPRTREEMGAYIDALARELAAAPRTDASRALLKRLAYTCDERIMPLLAEYFCRHDDGSYWIAEAVRYYVPDRDGRRAAFLAARAAAGTSGALFATLRAYGCTDAQVRALLHLGLAAEAHHAWPGATLLASREPADEHAPRLAAIATGWPTGRYAQQIRVSAIRALARHRTDASVAALKELLAHKIRWIREETADAIRAAYRLAKDAPGRRLLPTDFPALRP